ncbi:conserved hypothetical protein [Vibrio crassostreae]|uniref:hypothetical protein n=1 Tax=Vibrio sp. ZF 223 TaxID=2056191 RepID=UPI000D33A500|nr:hypothetical protein [Vibrio sp. ZF 223]CAK2065578.1 conserved hypothetical protein [Vibrio crassostreae]PTQ03649.1 hypothetical protein CWO13_10005 [Vibrio sp. ZF 223]CAK2066829.1 conserved hypothetical protein [Vibrio crassostreae]CAK3457999.1 conserved hypothetical protein [Vibrio crassostreae]CAK3588612.1 conserved hypothetical protein [Vibrio crassostreae]
MNCITTTQQGYLRTSTDFDCQLVMLSDTEYTNLVSASQSLSIDSELYTAVSGWILLSFVSGHVLGRILKTLGKG